MFDPRRAEENLAADLAKVRMTTRMRLGVVAGVVIVGLFQTHFQVEAGSDGLTAIRTLMKSALPVLIVAVAGTGAVLALARRDIKRIQAAYDTKIFRIPVRKSRR